MDGEVELSHFSVGRSGLRGLGELHDASPASSWSPWKSLLPAVLLSLLVHGLLLFAARVPRAAHALRPVLVVTLTTATIERPAVAPQAPAAIPVPAPPAPAIAAQSRPRSAPAAPVAAAAAPPAMPPAPRPEAAATRSDAPAQPPEEPAQGPVPQGVPDVREIAPQLVGRRLQVSVWVDPAGTVTKAEVLPNELTPEQVTLLEQAIARVRFTPAPLPDPAAAALLLRTLLCFDEAGRLDVTSGECWNPQPVRGK